MTSKIKIGIIVAAYIPSKAHFLSFFNRCIDSLNKQTRVPDEVVFVVNGYFRDDFDDFVKLVQYNCIFKNKIINLEKKSGCAYARNIGAAYLDDDIDYIGFLDVDDRYHVNKLEKQEAFIRLNPSIDIVGTFHVDVNIDMNGIYTQTQSKEYDNSDELAAAITKENPVVGASALIKREVFQLLDGFVTEQIPGEIWPQYNAPMWEDWDMWIRAIASGYRIFNLNERLYYWHHDLSVSRDF